MQVRALKDAVASKADRAELRDVSNALRAVVAAKIERAECEQLLARKLDIRTFLSTQASAPDPMAAAPPSHSHRPAAAGVADDAGVWTAAGARGPHAAAGLGHAATAHRHTGCKLRPQRCWRSQLPIWCHR